MDVAVVDKVGVNVPDEDDVRVATLAVEDGVSEGTDEGVLEDVEETETVADVDGEDE